jgi:hypothetical protein
MKNMLFWIQKSIKGHSIFIRYNISNTVRSNILIILYVLYIRVTIKIITIFEELSLFVKGMSCRKAADSQSKWDTLSFFRCQVFKYIFFLFFISYHQNWHIIFPSAVTYFTFFFFLETKMESNCTPLEIG